MTRPISRKRLSEYVARRMLSDAEDHGSLEDFCEKLLAYPEMYFTELADGAIDCISLSECLAPRVVYDGK